MTTFDEVKKILVERFVVDAHNIQLTTDLQNELNLDSMDAMDLLFAVNEVFSIRMSERALEHIHTVEQLVTTIEKFKRGK